MEITESHMEFGEFEESNVFHIEESSQYKLIKTHGVSCCEFILLRDDKLFLVEAKESCPRAVREGYPEGEKEKQLKNFQDFITEITTKMRHTLELYGSVLLNRQPQDSLSELMREKGLHVAEIKPVLVVNTKGKGWSPDHEIQEALQMKMNPESRIWKVRPILVINEVKAREKHLII